MKCYAFLFIGIKKVQDIAPDLLPDIASGKTTVNKALSLANERPNGDGTPRISAKKASGGLTTKEFNKGRSEGAIFELLDYLSMWMSDYGKLPVLKDISNTITAWVPELEAMQDAGLDAGIDPDDGYHTDSAEDSGDGEDSDDTEDIASRLMEHSNLD